MCDQIGAALPVDGRQAPATSNAPHGKSATGDTALLTPEQYMDMLLARQAEYAAEHANVLGFPPLLDWFIRDGDERLVGMDAVNRDNAAHDRVEKRPTKPRHYKPASHWRSVIERTQTRMDSLAGVQRHATDDPAAYGGVGVRQTPRQRRKYADRVDRTAAEYVRLDARLKHATSMLRKAEARER